MDKNNVLNLKVIQIPEKSYFRPNEIIKLDNKIEKNSDKLHFGIFFYLKIQKIKKFKGRKSKTNSSDLKKFKYFHEEDKKVSRYQFYININSLDNNFYIHCISKNISNPTLIQVLEKPILLKKDLLIFFGESDCFVVKDIYENNNNNNEINNINKIKNCDYETLKKNHVPNSNFDYEDSEQIRKKIENFEPQNFYSIKSPQIKNRKSIEQLKNLQKLISNEYKYTKNKTNILNSNIYFDKKHIILEGILGKFNKKTFVFSALENQNTVVKIGKDNQNHLVFGNRLSDFHCQILYEINENKWFIVEKSIIEQNNFSEEGTYISIKTKEQFKKNIDSDGFLLEKNMIILVNETKLKVVSD